MKEVFKGVFRNGGFATIPLTMDSFFGEKIRDGKLRVWEPYRSKLCAAIARGLKTMPIKPGSSVLYLGAANGYTASFVSDLVGSKGGVYCVEISPIAMKDLLRVCEKRENMIPILADARKPESYERYVGGKVDVIFEDVADPDQAEIMLCNAKLLKKCGKGLIAVKARCIDSVEEPTKVYKEVERKFQTIFKILERIDLAPFEKDHLFIVLERK
ncbi:fibrillarin-like rRNA/tRNA 2'-O-methyltransferase [Candidatus Micrarchaeota archaeon]|nr:fibrillarin-like rRNA/tRNA 2'-O-methyltransferase [Candidatus Micrarchaeota archaeon]